MLGFCEFTALRRSLPAICCESLTTFHKLANITGIIGTKIAVLRRKRKIEIALIEAEGSAINRRVIIELGFDPVLEIQEACVSRRRPVITHRNMCAFFRAIELTLRHTVALYKIVPTRIFRMTI